MPLDGSEVTTLGIAGGPQVPYGDFTSSIPEPQVYLLDFEPMLTEVLELTPDFREVLEFAPAFEVL